MTKCPKCRAHCTDKEVKDDRCDLCVAELRGTAQWHKKADPKR